MSFPQKYARGILDNRYQLALRLVSENYIDLVDFKSIREKGRAFNIYTWQNDIQFYRLHGIEPELEPYSGWVPLLHFAKGKWSKYDKHGGLQGPEGGPLMPANMFFSDMEEFRNWLGEEEYRLLLSDLI